MPLFTLLARARLGGNVNRALLLFCWLIAPCRIATFPFLRTVLANRGATAAQAAEASSPESFPAAHLRLLRDAAEGRPIRLSQVIDLAVAWQTILTSESYARFLARGLEVGARDSHGAIDAIPRGLLDELEELAAVGAGDLPVEMLENWEEWRETLAGALVARLRNRLFSNVENSADDFFHDEDEETPPLLQCWERWLALYDATERLGALMGVDDVATAWYGGLQLNAWNGACRVFNTYGKESSWISYAMFTWVVTVAEKLGDEEAARVNSNNAAMCGIPLFTALETFLRLPKKALRWFSGSLEPYCSLVWWRREIPRVWRSAHKAILNRITVVLPLGGALIIVGILSLIWSFEGVCAGVILTLPLVVSGMVILYLIALRIEKRKLQKQAEESP